MFLLRTDLTKECYIIIRLDVVEHNRPMEKKEEENTSQIKLEKYSQNRKENKTNFWSRKRENKSLAAPKYNKIMYFSFILLYCVLFRSFFVVLFLLDSKASDVLHNKRR